MRFPLTGDERLKRCATEGCGGQQTWRLEAGGVGSNYCSGCKDNIEREGHMDRYQYGRVPSSVLARDEVGPRVPQMIANRAAQLQRERDIED